ncbi:MULTISPECIES: hypothetical protein [unclassified Crossiella]|uniref:hypothetical protein n=1 Tax=unclassified Crossiella TaxID=2620835 RepID=UPI001FFF3B81|nr:MULTISPECIES: hypothetical protein [unclassified Crossiella]MCK2237725.1 hypothetical protein [Crossiella sp. S99.2]MCK2255011.1 hypothetical protein [Crossiella sp. S99.1]
MTPMGLSEAARLLALAAAYDQRTVGEADVLAWRTALCGTSFAECESAILAHVRRETVRVTPAHILDRVQADRRMRADRRAALPTGADRATAAEAAQRGLALIREQMGWPAPSTAQLTALERPCPHPGCQAVATVLCRRVGSLRLARVLGRAGAVRLHPSRFNTTRQEVTA